jgi:UDP-GlcNAc3NAcA epimerase
MRIATIVGARPQFIKSAPVSRVLARTPGAEEVVVHTGQHYDENMSNIFFRELGLPEPRVNLHVGSHSNATQAGRLIEALERTLRDIRPDRVLVYGDTNSTMAGAIAAAHLGIPIAHVEAGLRGFDRSVPEEINRVVTDHLADLLFCPSATAVAHLRNEGITKGVHQVGDVMYDCVLLFRELVDSRSAVLRQLDVEPGRYFLTTIHRAENTDDPGRLGGLVQALLEINDSLGTVVWPVHPRARKSIDEAGIRGTDRLRLTQPLSYLDMQRLISSARCVLTDSGGIQKETFFHRVPCLTLRERSEWVETVQLGFNHVVGTDPQRIVAAARWAAVPHGRNFAEPYGDGNAADAIVALLTNTSTQPAGSTAAPCGQLRD